MIQDEDLKQFYSKLNIRELKYRINNVFNMGFEFSTLFKYANKDKISQFKERLRLFKENYKINNYALYIANKYINKTHITNAEILKVLLLVEYAEYYNKEYDKQLELFRKISKKVVLYENKKLKNKKRKMYNYEDAVLIHILAMPNNLGTTWEEYVNTITDYYANQVYNQAVIDIRLDKLKVHDDMLNKQNKRLLNYKPEKKDKFNGQIDNEIAHIITQTQLDMYRYYGIEKVRVMGILDTHTCEICEQYIGKIYNRDNIEIGVHIGSHYGCRCYLEAWKV